MTTHQLTDEAAIRALFDRTSRAWADADAHAFASAFTEDADYVTFFGPHYKGRADIEAVHRPLFEKWQKGSHLDGEIVSLRFLTPDVALVHGRGAVVKGRKRRNRFNTKVTLHVAVRQDGEWRFAAFHNTKQNWLLTALTTRHDPKPLA
ncbi:SgcJ/EcaC family oxidoreductase [Nocardia transvalensis]|uniref:SgcJ/EcaC family oxidoreductase n=1 Tax=Nocardia transvalensis TaxID=37333 RepID=UPI001895B1C4|nr:SgcJ/EcaC family oxidoreductase [Nocardia transvalensis]MBF6333411.1 SgcJ/EcaC family oxidoreductase [Nocardia transvalensis]